MWPIIMAVLRRNAVYITLPIAGVIGFIDNLKDGETDKNTVFEYISKIQCASAPERFQIDFIDSKKNGGKLLVINGFRFSHNKKHASRLYWKCSNCYKKKCPAIAIYDDITLDLCLCLMSCTTNAVVVVPNCNKNEK
ncbi:hypothetical protein GQX74_011817 [Glossina fuscipes]|nr:hypothetical protein GQX74_011817 [Glossina fuscipes]